ncbi:hypothetical protein AX17_007240 [Amanita inopinata Kibby_2008]|nr:hypothetical protein AX17_007240 [Amanita inopinata Kibby_2008]
MASRAKRLEDLYRKVLRDTKPITASQKDLFLEAIYTQEDRVNCISSLVASKNGLASLAVAMRCDLGFTFINNQAEKLLNYLRAREIGEIDSGRYLQKILTAMLLPPVFWSALCSAFKSKSLSTDGEMCFAWLLLKMLQFQSDATDLFHDIAEDETYLDPLLKSDSRETREYAQMITHIVDTGKVTDIADTELSPGGRHDNDFPDFRRIAIMPTADEMASGQKPFLRTSYLFEDPKTKDDRISIYLDNQFRLLREDMLSETRDSLQIALGKAKRRQRNLIVEGLQVLDVFYGPDNKPSKWAIRFKLTEDLPYFKDKQLKPEERKDYIKEHRRIFPHQSLTCLLVDDEIIAFPIVDRDETLLAQSPPILILQFDGELSTTKSLTRFKSGRKIKVMSIDVAVFSYTPILKAIQNAQQLPFSQELLFWDDSSSLSPPTVQLRNVISTMEGNPHEDLQALLNTPKSIKLDQSQAHSFLAGLTQRVSLIQGPPGTGKSFIGALLAKAIHDHSKQRILVVCYTNHALDQFLEDLMDIGIPEGDIVRLGVKTTTRTAPLALNQQKSNYRFAKADWSMIDSLKSEIDALQNVLGAMFRRYQSSSPSFQDILEFLEFQEPEFFEAFRVPAPEDGMSRVTRKGRTVGYTYLIYQWSNGWDCGIFEKDCDFSKPQMVWGMAPAERKRLFFKWKEEILREQLHTFYSTAKQYNECVHQLERKFSEKDSQILQSKRIVGCTTTGAAKYTELIQAASPSVLLVEEAGEILESHILTALGREKNQLILIGDHKQLRPKVNNYLLTVEKGEGYDLNMSMFERLVLRNYPHTTLSQQHRMRPEISALVRDLTYPDLKDAPSTQNRPDLRGIRDNIVFINHDKPEDKPLNELDRDATSSKQNTHEAQMILKIVRYLGQQGYGTDKLVILTPYLGQLQNLRSALSKETDPVLNDLDSHDLVCAGLVTPAAASMNKNPIRLATIDNYQGEESDIVIVSLTRSNSEHDIGFMFSPERVNVLLSRARNALIMIGNSDTFMHAKKGKELWSRLLELLRKDGHVYDGFPVKCERHPRRTALLKSPVDFNIEVPDGGCTEPCNAALNCGIHKCPSKCHQLYDHSKMPCQAYIFSRCDNNHDTSYFCHKGLSPVCANCDKQKRQAEKQQREDFALKEKRDRERKQHEEKVTELEEKIRNARQQIRDAQLAEERENVLREKAKVLQETLDLAARAASKGISTTISDFFSSPSSNPSSPNVPQAVGKPDQNAPTVSPPEQASGRPITVENPSTVPKRQPDTTSSSTPNEWVLKPSKSKQNWEQQKAVEGASNIAIDAIMEMTGLEAVKAQLLQIKSKIDVANGQNASLKGERFNVVLLGNPGTGKTTVARQYAKFLVTVGVLPGNEFVETTGSRLANDGVSGIQKMLEGVINNGGGAIFVDEAYQLADEHNFQGRQVLDYMLAEMENNTDKVVFILAGYSKQMEKFFEHNPGLKSRVPYELKFEDYKDPELLDMLVNLTQKQWKGEMKVEGGLHGLYCRIAVRRLGRGRGREGFGNARALQNMFAKIRERQAERIDDDRRKGLQPDYFVLTGEDIIGPDPTKVMKESEAWKKLQCMIGLESVKNAVRDFFTMVKTNYLRELQEENILEMSLNRVFLGPPGTGKTTVAQIYGQILKDLSLLSNGEVVVKNPSDFIGSALGQSESNTRNILASTVGKVLVIDEAYMLYTGTGGTGNQSDQYKTAVIDTIVAIVQSGMSDDRCVLMLGYEEQMTEMFQNVNPGLSRRFDIDRAFRFENFNDDELLRILELKLKQQDLKATEAAKNACIDLLSRARNRPNFGNGGEVDNVLSRAKTRSQRRLGAVADIVLQPEDFDPDHNRSEQASANLEKLFEDVVGCEVVIQKLRDYQNTARAMKARNMDARNKIPMNFIFKGPPGTGKTTTARKMGQVFYDMGFLASAKVVECSASDLVGQYVGQTGPKTTKMFEKALGQVLFIDEAYMLVGGHFGQEAMDEIVALLTNEKYMGKMMVILAGYDQDINRLMNGNTGLSSRFPETITFPNMAPERCLELLAKELAKDRVTFPALQDVTCATYIEMTNLISQLAQLASWGNGRDIKTLAGQMVQEVFKKGSEDDQAALAITNDDGLECVRAMLKERTDREQNVNVRNSSSSGLPVATQNQEPPPPPIVTTATATTAEQKPKPRKREPKKEKKQENKKANAGQADGVQRDPGVSDEVWRELQSAKRRVAEQERRARQAEAELTRKVEEQRKKEQEAAARKTELEERAKTARDEAERRELMWQRMEERLKGLAIKREREGIQRELEQKRKQEESRRKEALVQQKLRDLGICPMGFRWIPTGEGYRCSAGGHLVSNAQLGL